MALNKIIAAAIFILAASAAFAGEQEKWWNDGWDYRVLVKATSSKGIGTDLAYVRVPLPLDVENSGADIRVVAAGTEIPRTALWVSPGESAEIVFQFPKDSDSCWIYFGNPKAADPGNKLDASDLLILETWVRPKGSANSWAEFKKLLDGKKTLIGRGVRPKIWDGFNPFGLSQQYLSIYKGKIICAEDGEYSFATASDDSSFLFVDEKLIAQWPGAHGPGEGLWGQYSGKIKLEKGVHKIEYYQESQTGGQCSVAGWTPPSAKIVRLIADTDFVRPRAAEPASFERRGKKTTAAFTYSKVASINISGENFFFYRFKPWGIPPGTADFLWDFGDGIASAAVEPDHVFAGYGKFTVTLTVKTSDAEDTIKRIADTRILFLDSEDPFPRKFISAAEKYKIEELTADACRQFVQLYDYAELSGHVIRCYRALLQKDATLSGRMKDELTLRLADALVDEGEDAEAAALYKGLVRPDADKMISAQAGIGLARTMLYSSTAEARKQAEKIAGESTSSYRRAARAAWMLAGDAWRLEGNADNARAAYKKSEEFVSLKPDDAEKLIQSGSFAHTAEHYLHQKEYNWALKTALDWEEDFPEAKIEGYSSVLKAKAWFFMKKYALAQRELEALLKCNPSGNRTPAALLLIGEIQINQGNFGKAAAALEKLIKEHPEAVEVKEAETLLKQGREKQPKSDGKF